MCLMHIFRFVCFLYTFLVIVMLYFHIKLKSNILIFLTIQKLYHRIFDFMARFVDSLRHEKFSGEHLNKWQTRMILWLSTMQVLVIQCQT